MKKRPLVVLTGPTAVGKTKASISLAKAIGGEIISADSMQVYKYMDIGSAKIRPEEMHGIPHHLVDELLPSEEFNVVRFQEMAKKAVEHIYGRDRIPVVVGGTGFYIQALLYDIDFAENGTGSDIRDRLAGYAHRHGAEKLHERLAEVDEASAARIHPNNVKRVIRALEFYEQTGQKISEHNERERAKESPYNAVYFVLTDDRGHLYARIDGRVDKMIEDGLVDEVRGLKKMGYTKEMVSMQGLGYKEILDYLDGRCTLEEAVYTIKRDTRHFAKRQITWFKREKNVIWIDKKTYGYDEEEMVHAMIKHLEGVLCLEDFSGGTSS
ncbi:tRNA (adenosine(37)-N6)-dimethylallyltransferase MiaA [Dorea sp. D27]|uniref:tRNA (adenosine(37)-N6)-dimethylallyltransferase MiaA n=1 Tax=Dorea sp. D27 TaxID=658665 RepID=UPI0006734630|nr:tRNA (adenosine(37)-N6)-dimethylallyltransferase MiaA [Dorea sp. D27]KMZ55012.1 tRNA delta(2)-isopentenylpyrophosphate transferase [Dorea sp. D27]